MNNRDICEKCPDEDTNLCKDCDLVKSISRTQQPTSREIHVQAEKKESAERNELISDNN